MSLPEVVFDFGFSDPFVGAFFTVGDPVKGMVGSVPIGGDQWTTVDLGVVKSWRVTGGAGRADTPTQRYDAATATIVLHDPDRRFDAENLAGPYVAAGVSLVQPMVRVRIRAVWGGTSYPIFFGYADDWQPDYQGNDWTYVTLTATDPSKILADDDRLAGTPVGAGEDSGARVDRILDLSDWPADERVIAAGDTTLQATDHAGNALAELQLAQDTEMGEFYFDRQGRAVFRNRQASFTEARSTTSQATFGDDPDGWAISGELPYADVKPSSGDGSLANHISISRAGGTEQVVENSTSIAKYLKKTHTRNDLLMETDSDALAYANALLFEWSQRVYRFARIEFNTPAIEVEGVLWPQLLGREFGDRITVLRRPYGGGDPIERDCFIRGFEFDSDGAYWRTAWVLQDATRASYFVIGDPVLGRVGFNAISY
jgi:hypothetical protein